MYISNVTHPSQLLSSSPMLYETPNSTPRPFLFPSINGKESLLKTSITFSKIQQHHSITLTPIQSPLSTRRATLSPLRSGSPVRTYSTPPRLIATLYETPLQTTNLPPPTSSLVSPSHLPRSSRLSPSLIPQQSSIILSPPSSLLPLPSSFPPPSSSCLILSPSSFLLPHPPGSIYNNVETMKWMLEQKDIELKAWKKHAKHLQKHVKRLLIKKVENSLYFGRTNLKMSK